MNKSLIVEELGRSQTVKDVERAYQLLFDANRKFAARMRHARENAERKQAEVALFLDDLRTITGLTFESKLFWKLVGLTLDIRLRRHQIETTEASWREMCGALADGWDLDTPSPDLPGDDDFVKISLAQRTDLSSEDKKKMHDDYKAFQA